MPNPFEKKNSFIKDNYTALHIAVQSAKPAVVETLLGYGAEVHVCGGRLRETPLHIAAKVQDGDRCALMLLKSGANPNWATDDGQTPVHVAARHGNLASLILLLEDGGDALIKSNVRKHALDGGTFIREEQPKVKSSLSTNYFYFIISLSLSIKNKYNKKLNTLIIQH